MVLCMPDYNQVFHRVGREPAGLRAGLALLRHRRKIRKGGLFAIGVLPEARRRRLAETLAARALQHFVEKGFTEVEYCLVLEDNVPSQRIARRFGGVHTKTYLMFEKVLAGRS
ncbi:MAG: GNAT family N-acetyltransferase, partial [Candidatus Binatia bacterium]